MNHTPISPYTGWTRQTWEQLADRMLLAMRPYAGESHALIDLPGPVSMSGRRSDGLEGFARSFLLAAFRLAGAGGADEHGFADWYASGLAAGTNPAHPDAWPRFSETRQAKVEAASIAIALHETRPWIWDRLDDTHRGRVIDWFAEILGDPIWENNWTWFQAVIEAFLRSVGGPWNEADLDRTLERTERWYVGDGWYSDGWLEPGGARNFDYYSGWAMHFYPLWYCRISGLDAGHELTSRYRERLHDYLDDARLLIAASGAPLYQGRSLVYRFAVLAPFWAGALFDATPLTPGETRRLASGVVKHFVDNGCLDENGVLSLGWHGAFPRMRQHYSGPGSPYWAAKGFAGLLLPTDHPVWTQAEQPLPIERGDFRRTLPAPGWLVSGTRADGIVRIAAHGPDHATTDRPHVDEPEYARHAYSTHTGPDIGRTHPLDSHVALISVDGRPSHRRPAETLVIDGNAAVSRSRAHWLLGDAPEPYLTEGEPAFEQGPRLTTASVLHGPWELRLARIDGISISGPCHLRIGGWPLAADEPCHTETDSAAHTAVCRTGTLTSSIRGLRGLPTVGIHHAEAANAFGRHTATPWAMTDEPAAPGRIYAALVTLTGTAAPDHAVRVEVHGGQVTVQWPDGEQERLPTLFT